MINGHYYHRDLPHLERDFEPMFITFCTAGRTELPGTARNIALDSCVREHGRRVHLYAAIVMPDHVHLALKRMFDNERRCVYPLREITQAIKSASAHRINRLIKRSGPVWQDESFDRVVRSSDSLHAKIAYILDNPVRKGIAKSRYEHPYLWMADPELLTQVPLRER